MSNLVLTSRCQRKCEYCFAKDFITSDSELSFDNFIRIVEFLNTGPKNINLLGGEPTLHKDFNLMLRYLIEKDFRIQVFTNGMVSSEFLNSLISVLNKFVLKENQLYFAVNVREEKYRSKLETKLQERFFDYLGHLSYPSFVIQDINSDLLFLKDIVEKFKTDNTIKLSLAHPINGGVNKHLKPEEYKDVAINIIKLCENTPDIYKRFDCGFVLCMFSLQEIGRLRTDEKNDFMFSCDIPLDIYPDLSVSNCFSLSKIFKTNITNFKDVYELINYFYEGLMTPTGVFKERCNECEFFRKECSGGCKGFYEPENRRKDENSVVE